MRQALTFSLEVWLASVAFASVLLLVLCAVFLSWCGNALNIN